MTSKNDTKNETEVKCKGSNLNRRGDCDGGLGGYDGGEGGESGGGRRPALRQVCPHIKVLIEFINRLFIFNAWF